MIKLTGEAAAAFQDALDKSGVGGKISYRPHPKKIGEWVFKYTPPKDEAGSHGAF